MVVVVVVVMVAVAVRWCGDVVWVVVVVGDVGESIGTRICVWYSLWSMCPSLLPSLFPSLGKGLALICASEARIRGSETLSETRKCPTPSK